MTIPGQPPPESPAPSRPKRLPRTVITLGWVSFFSDVSSEMAYPLLPLFVTGVLGASATALGWAEGVALALVAMLTGWAGWKSDRSRRGGPRRVPWIRWGYGLPVAGKLIVAGAVGWPMVLVGRAVDRFGKGLRGSPRDALIADATLPEQRGRAYGFHRVMDTGGAFVGVIFAAGILAALGAFTDQPTTSGVRPILFVAAAMGVASLAFTFMVRETPPGTAPTTHESASNDSETTGRQEETPEQGAAASGQGGAASRQGAAASGQGGAASSRPLGRAYWLALAPMLVFALANSSDTFVLLRATDLGLSPLAVVLAYALYNLVYTLVSYPAGVFSDRFGRWRTIALGWGVYALTYAGLALTGAAGLWALMALYGVYAALTEGVGKALIADLAPPGRRGAALGVFSMSVGLTMLGASVLAGVLWDTIAPEAPFWFGAGASVVAIGLIPVAWFAARRTPGSG